MPVYYAQIEGRTFVKIGFSRAPLRRLAQIQACNVDRFSITRLMLGEWSDEYRLHQMFAALHVRSEWYHLVEEMFGDLGLEELPVPDAPTEAAFSPVQARAARNNSISEKWANPRSSFRIRRPVFTAVAAPKEGEAA